jgi:hypothetical protein
MTSGSISGPYFGWSRRFSSLVQMTRRAIGRPHRRMPAPRPRFHCLEAIPVDEVVRAAIELLERDDGVRRGPAAAAIMAGGS